MPGDLKGKLGTSTAITFTSVASLATSSTKLAGAESAAVSNLSNLYDRVWVAGTIKMGASTPTVDKAIEVWIVPALDDTPTWPDVFAGADAARTATSNYMKYAGLRPGDFAGVDATANQIYPIGFEISQRCGLVPLQWSLFVTQDSGQSLAASGSAFKYTGLYGQYT